MPEPDVQPEMPEGFPPEQTPVAEAVDTDNSSSEDAVLDRLLGFDETEPQVDVRSPEPSAPDHDFDRALKALQRDGVPPDVIDSLKSNPSKVKEWGLKAAKRQADVDAFGAKKADEAKKSQANPSETPNGSVETDDNEADADPLSKFGELFGDDAAKPLRSMADRLRADFDERAKALEARYETQASYLRIASDYGKNAPSLTDITEVAARIGRENPGKFDSIDAIVQEAFRTKVGEPKKTDPRNTARPTVGKPAPRAVRQVDRDDMVLNVLLSGGSRADALRAVSR